MPQQELLIRQKQTQSFQEKQSFIFVQILLQATVCPVPPSSETGLLLTTKNAGCEYRLSSVSTLQSLLILTPNLTLSRDLLPEECFETRDAAAIFNRADCLYDQTTGIRRSSSTSKTSFKGAACRKSFKVLARSELPGAGVNAILDWLVCTPDTSLSMRILLICVQGDHFYGSTRSHH